MEAGYAYALHLNDAPVGDCLAAYRTAIELNPQLGALRLNLAQLLFLRDDGRQARQNLEGAVRLGLDDAARLEALFYRLSHTDTDAKEVFREAKMLLDRGARLRWNIQPNIEFVRRTEPKKAALLEKISKIFKGEQDQPRLDELISRWEGESGR